jgi:hypothetical protein
LISPFGPDFAHLWRGRKNPFDKTNLINYMIGHVIDHVTDHHSMLIFPISLSSTHVTAFNARF